MKVCLEMIIFFSIEIVYHENYRWVLSDNYRHNPGGAASPFLHVKVLVFRKINEPNVYTYNIVIYGDTIDASMLAYYIENKIEDEL